MTLTFGGGAGVLTIPGLTSDGASPGGIVVAGAIQGGSSLNIGDFTNPPDPTQPFQVGPGGGDFYIQSGGIVTAKDSVTTTRVLALNGTSVFTAHDTSGQGIHVNGKGGSTSDAFSFDVTNASNVTAGIDGAGNIKSEKGLGIFNHAAPASQVTLATGAAHTVDDVITLLQSYGLCKQS